MPAFKTKRIRKDNEEGHPGFAESSWWRAEALSCQRSERAIDEKQEVQGVNSAG